MKRSFIINQWILIGLILWSSTVFAQVNIMTSSSESRTVATMSKTRYSSQSLLAIAQANEIGNINAYDIEQISEDKDTTSHHVFRYHRSVILDFGMGFGSGGTNGTSSAVHVAFMFPVVKGSRHLIGYTMGYEDLAARYDAISFPIGMRYQVFFSRNESVKPFFYVNGGLGFVTLKDEFAAFRDENITCFRKEIGIGISFVNMTKDIAWYIKTSYINQTQNYELIPNRGGFNTQIEEELQRMMFSVGVYF